MKLLPLLTMAMSLVIQIEPPPFTTLSIESPDLTSSKQSHLFARQAPRVYSPDTILPNRPQEQLDSATRTYHQQWKASYLGRDCGSDRYYIKAGGTAEKGSSMDRISVSEGHGYGMMIAVYTADFDPDAQNIFDGLYRFFRDHPSVHSPDLMAWEQKTGCVNSAGNLTDSATDGDLDIAYSLLLADVRWGSQGTINYLENAKKMLNAIETHEINQSTFTPTLGDSESKTHSKYYYGTRISDLMPAHFRSFSQVSQSSVWSKVLDKSYALVNSLQDTFSSNVGLVPDFVENLNTVSKPAPAEYLEGAADGRYSFNSCRVPWRISMDALLNGNPQAKEIVQKINKWIRKQTQQNPSQITAGYYLNGTEASEEKGNIAFAAPFAVAAMVDPSNQQWLDASWDYLNTISISPGGYFRDTIKMMTMITLSGKAWSPGSPYGDPLHTTPKQRGSGLKKFGLNYSSAALISLMLLLLDTAN